jgi:hypothetical protein
MRVSLQDGKPVAQYAHTLEAVGAYWRATIVLSNRHGAILERVRCFGATQAEATEAALAALSGRWTWRYR